jgi:phosphoribosyl 1,2-cyclic phosphodiesterase
MTKEKEDLETLIFCNFVLEDHKDREIRNVIIFDERGEPQQIKSSKYKMEFYRQSDRVCAEDKWGYQFVWDLRNLNKGPKLEIPNKCCTTSADPETMTAIAKEELSRFTEKDKIPFPKLCDTSKSTYLTKNLESTGLKVNIPRAKIKFIPIGIGDASSKNNSSFIIEANRKYLVDLPPNIEDMLENAYLFLDDINDVIITHAHGDHIGSLQWFLLQKINANQKVNIYTTKEIFEQTLSTIISPWIREQAKSNSIILKELNTERPYEENSIKIDIRANIHETGVPTIGFKFSYKGKTLGYSSDCRYDKDLSNNKIKEYTKLVSAIYPAELPDDLDELDLSELIDLTNLSEDEVLKILWKTLPPTDLVHINWQLKSREWARQCGSDYSHIDCGHKKDLVNYLLDKLHLYEKSLVSWFSDCDTIIHEATDNPNDSVHTYVGELEKLPKEIKEKMVLIHIPDSFKKNYAGSIPVLREGTRYRL